MVDTPACSAAHGWGPLGFWRACGGLFLGQVLLHTFANITCMLIHFMQLELFVHMSSVNATVGSQQCFTFDQRSLDQGSVIFHTSM
jgi:hypothetical protein